MRSASTIRSHFERHPPIFIVGSPRSGTTLLLRLLDVQPQCTRFWEPFRLWKQAQGYIHPELPPDDAIDSLGPIERLRLRRRYHDRLKPGRPVALSKDPRDSLKIRAITQAFPAARFIHIIRDPRDCILSIAAGFEPGSRYIVEPGWAHTRFVGWRAHRDEPHLIKAAHIWRACVEAVTRDLADLPDRRRVTMRFEHLLRDPGAELRRALNVVLPGYSHEALQEVVSLVSADIEPASHRPPVATGYERSAARSSAARSSADAGSGTLSTGRRIGGWRERLSPAQYAAIQPIIGGLMTSLSYV